MREIRAGLKTFTTRVKALVGHEAGSRREKTMVRGARVEAVSWPLGRRQEKSLTAGSDGGPAEGV